MGTSSAGRLRPPGESAKIDRMESGPPFHAAPSVERPQRAVPAGRGRGWYRSRRFRWTVRLVAVAALVGYPTIVGLDGLFYHPDSRQYFAPGDFGLQHEDVDFVTRDGLRLHGWFLPASGTPRGLVVHFHGNAANITNHVALVYWLPAAGYHVLMFDYRGYGESEGQVTREGTISDGHAAIDYALSRPEAADLPLFAYGQSLGGAVAVCVAAERPAVAAVVAESAFSDYRRIAAMHAQKLVWFDALGHVLAWSVSDGHDPVDVIGKIAPRPVFVIAAEKDAICFPELARELYEAAREPKRYWLVPGAEHLRIVEEHEAELTRRVTAFFAEAVAKP